MSDIKVKLLAHIRSASEHGHVMDAGVMGEALLEIERLEKQLKNQRLHDWSIELDERALILRNGTMSLTALAEYVTFYDTASNDSARRIKTEDLEKERN